MKSKKRVIFKSCHSKVFKKGEDIMEVSEENEVKRGVCFWCHNHCTVEVYIKNGRLDRIEEDKNQIHADVIRTTVRACPRARACKEWFYHPDRLAYPLKRVGEKGEGKWENISWEQALDEIATKLKELKERYGPETLATTSGTGRTHDEYRTRFFNLFGSPNNIGQSNICYGPGQTVSCAIYGWPGNWSPMARGTRCIMLLGSNPEQGARTQWQSVLRRIREGAKLIVVDPRRTVAAEWANVWLQLRPGTDTALYMSMINVIIREGLYDKEFVDKWTYGFDKLAERATNYSPEKVSGITWVPAEKIKEAAIMYATNKPGLIYHMMGLEHIPNSIEALHARFIFSAITGNIDVIGGEMFHNKPPSISEYSMELNEKVTSEQKQKQIGADQFKLMAWPGYDLISEGLKKVSVEEGRWGVCLAHAPSVYSAMITGKPYPVRAMITVSSNPMVTQANTKLVYKALKSLDLYVVHDFWMTPSAELADYVLPCASWLERPVLFTYWDMTGFIEAGETALPGIVEGECDRRPDYDLWRGLGITLGQEEYWPWETLEDSLSYRLKPMGYTLKEFIIKRGGSYRPTREERKYEKLGFGTLTGKIELYSTVLEKLGYDPLPHYEEPPESPISNPELAKRYPLILITGSRFMPMYHSEHRQIDSLRKEYPEPMVEINPQTASELGISDGNWVWIETPRGRVRQKCRYFNGIDRRVVNAQHGWWFPELPGEEPWLHGVWESNINVVTNDDPAHCNKINGGWTLRALLCKVYKARQF